MVDLLDYLQKNAPKGIKLNQQESDFGDIVIVSPTQIVEFLTFLKNDAQCLFQQLTDLTCVDYPANEKRFELIYQLLSFKYNKRLTVKVVVDALTTISSVASVFSSATWFEREVFDMYGIKFDNCPDMRRILTDYGFEGHPQRKDFPLTGYKQVRYDPTQGKVVYEPVKLDQAYRDFDFSSPWQGTDYVLPGDEKAD